MGRLIPPSFGASIVCKISFLLTNFLIRCYGYDVPTEGFKYLGAPPAVAGLFVTKADADIELYHGLSSTQGYAFIIPDDTLRLFYGTALSFDCVPGTDNSTFFTAYENGRIYANGTITSGTRTGQTNEFTTENSVKCERSTVNKERWIFEDGVSCPENFSSSAHTESRIQNSVQPPADLPCDSPSNLSEASKFMTNKTYTPINVNSVFAPFANPGLPPGFAGVIYEPPAGEYTGVQVSEPSSFALVNFVDFSEEYYAAIGEYISYECIDRYTYRSTYSIRYYYSNGTVTAFARCRLGAYDPVSRTDTIIFSNSACPKNMNDTAGFKVKSFDVSGPARECSPLPSTSPGPTPPPSSSSEKVQGVLRLRVASVLLLLYTILI